MSDWMRFVWDLRSQRFELDWELPTGNSRNDLKNFYWNEVPHDVLRSSEYSHYLRNDPFPQLAQDLAGHLAAVAVVQGIDPESIDGLNYLLHFVHRLDYIKDPKLPHDYPRYPGETIVFHGGDCEDSAMLFAALASYWGHRTCLHDYVNRRHISAGVEHLDGTGVSYNYEGIEYFVAETAIDGNGYVDVGEPFSFWKKAKSRITPLPFSDTGIEPIPLNNFPEPTIVISHIDPGRLILKSGRLELHLEDTTVIGRRDLRPHPGSETVSKKHARFFPDGGQWFVIALPSLNPTKVNGSVLKDYRRHELNPGDRIHVGKVKLTVQ